MAMQEQLCFDCDANPIEPGCGVLCKSCYGLAQTAKQKKADDSKTGEERERLGGATLSGSMSYGHMPPPWVFVKDQKELAEFRKNQPNFLGTAICEDALKWAVPQGKETSVCGEITKQSRHGQKAAALFYRDLGVDPRIHKARFPIWDWWRKMEELQSNSGMNYLEFVEFLYWVLNIHDWTMQNLRLACLNKDESKGPLVSFEKQFPRLFGVYKSKLDAQRAKARLRQNLSDPGGLIVEQKCKDLDGGPYTRRVIQHPANDYGEWEQLHDNLRDSRLVTNPDVARRIIQSNESLLKTKCLRCNGTGTTLVRNGWRTKCRDCLCLDTNPFPRPEY